MKRYPVKECFLSLQGEGMRAGEASTFLRFSGCNLNCRRETHGFDCDTDHKGGQGMTVDEVCALVMLTAGKVPWVVLTGGEPALHIDQPLLEALGDNHLLAIETNGTLELPHEDLDWITVSPKRGEPIRVPYADEVKVVLAAGEPIPDLHGLQADAHLLSPAFEGDTLPVANLQHCIRLCLEDPRWRLSVQQHKGWGVK